MKVEGFIPLPLFYEQRGDNLTYFKNKNTGVTWHITNKDHIKRLRADTGYLEVANNKHQEVKETAPSVKNKDSISKKVTKKPENNKKSTEKELNRKRIEIEMMEWQELRQYASSKNINTRSKKRKQIEKELIKKLGDKNVTKR